VLSLTPASPATALTDVPPLGALYAFCQRPPTQRSSELALAVPPVAPPPPSAPVQLSSLSIRGIRVYL
jgi:hypothetical protein